MNLVYHVGLRVPFRGLVARDGMLLRGSVGWGEFSPFWDYDDATAAPWLACAVEAAGVGWPLPVRQRVPVNVIIPAVGAERARELVLASGGCRTAKVKVAQKIPMAQGASGGSERCTEDGEVIAHTGRRNHPESCYQNPGSPGGSSAIEPLDAEVARIAAVRAALDELYGKGVGRIRIDANGSWTVPQAIEHIRELDAVAGGLEYVEQPCATVTELAELRRELARRGIDVLIAADESIRLATDPLRVRDLGAADVAVLKVAPLGGVRAALRIAEQIQLPVVVSSAIETSIGLAAGLALAGALPELPYACGLATANLLTADVVAQPLIPTDGQLPVLPANSPRLIPVIATSGAAPNRPNRPVWLADRALAQKWLQRYQLVCGEHWRLSGG